MEHIDIRKTLRERLPGKSRYIPSFVVRWLERLVRQDEMNETLDVIGERRGVNAAVAALDHLGITVEATGEEHIPSGGRFLFVSNHPLGGLDGIALIARIGKRYGGEIRFLVNDLLMAVEPLRDVFLPINKYGRQGREAVAQIESEYAGDRQMLTFPAGLCSRRLPDGTIGDLDWKKTAVTMAARYKRDIIPIYFDAVNSKRFYRIARWRERLGIRFNYEMILLPDELYRKRGATLRFTVGEPIAWQTLDTTRAKQEIDRIRGVVYSMRK